MQATDAKAFMKILMTISELYGKNISTLLGRIYWQALKPFEFEDVKRAFWSHVHNPDGGQFFPKPADIVRLIEGGGEIRSLSAWAKVEEAIRQVGIYQSVVFDDPLIHAVLEEMGGWVKLGLTHNKHIPFLAREFQKRYMGFVMRPPMRYPKYCCGIIEGENVKNGYRAPPPVFIGELKKAEQVLLNGGGRLLCTYSGELMEQIMKRLLPPKSPSVEETSALEDPLTQNNAF